MNYFENTGLTAEDIADLRTEFECQPKYLYRYYLTMTWKENPSWSYEMDGVTFEKKRESQINSYFMTVAQSSRKKGRNNGTHFKSFAAISRPHINKHFHGVIQSEFPIPVTIARAAWKHGTTEFVKYNPRWAEERGLSPTRGAINYIFGKHQEHRKLVFGDVWCPAKKGSCKNGNCKHRKENYKQRVLI